MLSGIIQVNETYIGGNRSSQRGGGAAEKTVVRIGAVKPNI